MKIKKDIQFYKFCTYGFLKNLRFFDPFILLYFREIGFSFFSIGLLFSVREISNFILEVPSGIIADWYGRKNAMIFSFISYIFAFIMFYLFSQFEILIIAMILFAFGEAFRSGTHKAIIFKYLNDNNLSKYKTEYYGYTRSWSQIGSAISALIAGFLIITLNNYRIIFLAVLIPYIVELFILLTYPKDIGVYNKISLKNELLKSFQNTFMFIKSREYNQGVFNSILYDSLFKIIKDYFQILLKSFAISLPLLLSLDQKDRIAIVVAIIYSITFYLTSIASRKAIFFQHKFKNIENAINYSFLLGVFAILFSGIFYQLNFHFISIISFVLLYIIQNIRRPININYISSKIDKKYIATGLSMETQLKTLFIAILSPILGFITDLYGIGIGIILLSSIFIGFYPIIKIKKNL